jgi:hypothetical protein
MLNGIVALAARTELTVGGSTKAWTAGQAEFLATVAADGSHPHLAAALADSADAATTSHDDLIDRILPQMLAGLLRAASAGRFWKSTQGPDRGQPPDQQIRYMNRTGGGGDRS